MSGAAIEFTVYGNPVQQGSKRAFVVGKRAVIVDDNKATLKPWRAALTSGAHDALGGEPGFDEPVQINLRFVMPRPKSVKREHPSVKPDIDKLARSVLDALTDATAIKDDAQVVTMNVTKQYEGEGYLPGVSVRISRQGTR